MACQKGCRNTDIFETHRNEDLISGAPILAPITGATVHHGPASRRRRGDLRRNRVRGSQLRVRQHDVARAETPGHADDSLSFSLHDDDFGNEAVGVFTGDVLFVGDVGRTDFYPDRACKVAGMLYDSLQKLVGLGDQALIYPAHGSGSVCGSGMADREFSSLGFERRNNPMLRIDDQETFIDQKVAEQHEQPPYFRLMEELNLSGADAMNPVMIPPALSLPEFEKREGDAVAIDVRSVTTWLGVHVPGSMVMPCDMVPAFGWYLDAR